MGDTSLDWFILWKFYHCKFFWMLLATGIPVRALIARRVEGVSWNKKGLFAVAATLASSVCGTWFPIIPLIFGALSRLTIGIATTLFWVSVPLVAVSMTIETTLIDAALVRLLLKAQVKSRIGLLLFGNAFNVVLALTYVFVWRFYHPIQFIALVDGLWR